MITRDDVIDEWVYCNDDDDRCILTKRNIPEELIPDIINYANEFIENPEIIDQTEKTAFSKLSDGDKQAVSIYRAFIKYLPSYIRDFDLIVDSAYDNMNIILR